MRIAKEAEDADIDGITDKLGIGGGGTVLSHAPSRSARDANPSRARLEIPPCSARHTPSVHARAGWARDEPPGAQ
jgi:hypothetical protein